MTLYNPLDDATICAPATLTGSAAIAIIRMSGNEALNIAKKIFKPSKKDKDIYRANSHTIHYGTICKNNEVIDEVILSIFKSPCSYTGENIVEISCHGSLYIQQTILELLIENGCRLAHPGEFTFRAFINGKLDLSQAEAVADLIAANSKTAHDLAIKQLKGGFSKKIESLRHELLKFVSLIELELDFSEEDVAFADRKDLLALLQNINNEIKSLHDSFEIGNILKKGIPVAIIGKPNVGKSTLLNALLNEDRAIVSAIPGTTRDTIEDTLTIEGITFRFIDTAGLRSSEDEIESLGINKTIEKIKQAYIILFVFDISHTQIADLLEALAEIEEIYDNEDKKIILVGNKSDLLFETPPDFKKLVEKETIFVSAKRKGNVGLITECLLNIVKKAQFSSSEAIVSNTRHYNALKEAHKIIDEILISFEKNISQEFLAADLKRALYYLSEISGIQINNEQVLQEIFSSFCIGK